MVSLSTEVEFPGKGFEAAEQVEASGELVLCGEAVLAGSKDSELTDSDDRMLTGIG